MSRTHKTAKAPGTEYGKSRLQPYRYGEMTGRFTKRLTHKLERREAKLDAVDLYNSMIQNEDTEDWGD